MKSKLSDWGPKFPKKLEHKIALLKFHVRFDFAVSHTQAVGGEGVRHFSSQFPWSYECPTCSHICAPVLLCALTCEFSCVCFHMRAVMCAFIGAFPYVSYHVSTPAFAHMYLLICVLTVSCVPPCAFICDLPCILPYVYPHIWSLQCATLYALI